MYVILKKKEIEILLQLLEFNVEMFWMADVFGHFEWLTEKVEQHFKFYRWDKLEILGNIIRVKKCIN